MKTTGESIPRRAFLTGAASMLGASVLGVAPQLGGPAGGIGVSGLAAYFWNGTKFVPVAQAPAQTYVNQTVKVQIQEVMGSSTPIALDAILPGGVFHAYVGTPTGSGRATFAAPFSSAGFSIAVGHTQASQTVTLGAKGALGFYLLVSPLQKVGSLLLLEGTETKVIDTSGAPLGNPTILVQLS